MCGSANWYNKPNNVTSIWTWGFSMPWSIVGFKWEFLAPFCCPRLCALVSYPIKWVLCTCNLAKGSSVKWTISALLSHVALCHYLVKYLIPFLKGLLSFCMFNVQFRLNNQIVRQTDVVAMGSSSRSLLANDFMINSEDGSIESLIQDFCLCGRYLGDVLCVITPVRK